MNSSFESSKIREDIYIETKDYIEKLPVVFSSIHLVYDRVLSERALFMMALIQGMLNSGVYDLEFNSKDVEASRGYALNVAQDDETGTTKISIIFPDGGSQ